MLKPVKKQPKPWLPKSWLFGESLARSIMETHETIREQAAEIERLREIEELYNKLLRDSIEHNAIMMANLLEAILQSKESSDV